MPISYLAHFSVLKLEATHFPETSAGFQQIALRYNPEEPFKKVRLFVWLTV
jgi:hypothetical protein